MSWVPNKATVPPLKPVPPRGVSATNGLRASRRSRLLKALERGKNKPDNVAAPTSIYEYKSDRTFEIDSMTLRLDELVSTVTPGATSEHNGPRAMEGQWITSPRVYKTKRMVSARRKLKVREKEKNAKEDEPRVPHRPAPTQVNANVESNPWVEEILDLETGADAMAFFARYGHECPIKFVFLSRPEGALTNVKLRPYDLNVVMVGPIAESDLEFPPIPYELENNELFTMTSKGLVNVVPGEPSVFIPLEKWMRESTIFKLLGNIAFYKNFRLTKLFGVWKKNVQFRLYAKKRMAVANRLFMAKPAFIITTIDINSKLEDMNRRCFIATQFVSAMIKKLSGIDAFLHYQSKNRNETRDALNIIVEQMHEMVENTCKSVVDVAQRAGEEVEKEAQGFFSEDARRLPLVTQKEQHFKRLEALKIAEQEKEMLPMYIRYLDYMQCETLASMCVNNARSLLEEMTAPGGARITFETSVKFTRSLEVAFQPNEHVIKEGMEVLGEQTFITAHKVSRLCDVHLPVLRRKMRAILSDRPDVEKIVRSSKPFQSSLKQIIDKVGLDFMAVREYARAFHTVRPIVDYIKLWNFDDYKKEARDMTKVKGGIRKTREMEKMLNRMRITNKIGIVIVETRDLKTKLMPTITGIMNDMKDLLKKMARDQCLNITKIFQKEYALLEARPAHLDKFADVVRNYKNSSKNLVSNNQQTASVDEMIRLLNQLDVRIDSTMMVEVEDMRSAQSLHAREMGELSQFIEANLPEQKQQLDVQIIRMDENLANLQESLTHGEFVNENAEIGTVLGLLDNVKRKLETSTKSADRYKEYQELFGVGVAYEFETLKSCQAYYDSKYLLWNSQYTYEHCMTTWMQSPFETVDVNDLGQKVEEYFQTAHRLNKKFSDNVTKQFVDRVKMFRADVPTVIEFGNPSMQPEHKRKIFEAMDVDFDVINEGGITLEKLVEHDIFDFKNIISDMSALATGQSRLLEGLSKIEEVWQTYALPLQSYRNADNKYILGDLEEFLTQMEDDQVALQTMLSSRNVSMIQNDVEQWQYRLSLLSDTLDEWMQVQRNWMYLENIFSGEDIRNQLPEEANKFISVDAEWNSTMRSVSLDPIAMTCVGPDKFGASDKLLTSFQSCNKILEEVQRGLEDYLQLKREAFPRFYFLSNDELLEILAQTREPRAVQPHMRKCFDCIASLNFVSDDSDADDDAGLRTIMWQMTGMHSADGEIVNWSEAVMATGSVEKWLLQVESMMRKTLYDKTVLATAGFPTENPGNRDDWITKGGYPAQCVLLVDQIAWTQGVTDALRKIENDPSSREPLQSYMAIQSEQISSMVKIVRGKITKDVRTLVGTLLTIDVHCREVVHDLIEDKDVNSVNSFRWQKQLRYYWDSEVNDCVVRQANARFLYGYEYLGNGFRLVVTPLTDKIYLTLTGGLQLKLGGAPAGPAGTGKTETTKDLAKALGRQCVVFNCQEGLDFVMMGQFFSGLASGGAWACFDEFNRIFIEVLSVIAQQILTIQQALLRDLSEFQFNGHMIALNSNFGVFITMNPGYAGRTELPDNLKALFRPVACMVPDYRLIAEIILMSQGFDGASVLSTKLALLYRLSSEQLSDQSHYDFGMRAVKSVLMMAGRLKMQEPDTKENILLIRALRDSNVPKFVSFDVPLFQRIISDLFPGVNVPYVDYGKLQEAVKQSLTANKLIPVPSFVHKVIQVHETMLVRHGMMLVGECGSGKSTNIHTLADALANLQADGVTDVDNFFRRCDSFVLNPKSVTMEEMYGNFNGLTQEWTDGLVAKLVREAAVAVDKNRKWVVFDGPVDTLWIESMNTVLDDNKSLCLSNGERIKIPDSMHMVFEVEDLTQASPATVSRCGMVFMQQLHIGLLPLVNVWGEELGKNTSPALSLRFVVLLEKYLEEILQFVEEKCHSTVIVPKMCATQSFLRMLSRMCLSEPKCFDSKNAHADTLADMLFVYCLIWGLGGSISAKDRPSFSNFVTDILQGKEKMIGMFDPNEYTLYDVFVDTNATAFKSWETNVPEYKFDHDVSFFELFVPTSDTMCMTAVLDTIVKDGRHGICIGESGVGKSAVTQGHVQALCRKEPDAFDNVVVSLSAQTNSHNMQSVLETKLEKKRKTLLGPKGMRKMVILVDDLNLPRPDLYGSQPALELLRQVIDSGGFYDRKKLFFKNVQGASFLGTCAPPGGARNAISERLLRHFHVLWFTEPTEKSLQMIFQSILGGHLGIVAPEIMEHNSNIVFNLVCGAIDIYKAICKEMRPTPAKSHYTFNLRDASKVFQGMLMFNRKSVFSLPKDAKPDASVNATDGTARLFRGWLHEHLRVYADRFNGHGDAVWFGDTCKDTALKYFGDAEEFMKWDDESVEQSDSDYKTLTYLSGIMFANLTGNDDSGEYRDYEFRTSDHVKGLGTILQTYMDDFNTMHSGGVAMDLVFFRDAVSHLARITRILLQPRGNALLVGVGGSGRQSLTRLASFMAGAELRQIEISRAYGMDEWREDIKKALIAAGSGRGHIVFLITDAQVFDDSCLEDVNGILSSGEVLNLYEPDDLENIASAVRSECESYRKHNDISGAPSRDDIIFYFQQRVRERLHIVLAFSPIGTTFRKRMLQYPSFSNCCTIDWFHPWPEDALISVAEKVLSNHVRILGSDDLVAPVSKLCMTLHASVEKAAHQFYVEAGRSYYVTPTSYLELLKLFLSTLLKQRDSVQGNVKRYETGVRLLTETGIKVKELQAELIRLQPEMKQAAIDTEKLLEQLKVDQKLAEETKAEASKAEAAASKLAKSCETQAAECQAELDKAMPAYHKAVKALSKLDKKDISEMKTFTTPPLLVGVTMEAVCLLLGRKQTWADSKKLLGQLNFLDQLKSFDKDGLTPKIIKKLQKFIDREDFTPERVQKQSVAAMSICMWVHAMYTYYTVARTIEPKKLALGKAREQLAEVRKRLKEKQDVLAAVEKKLKELQEQYEASMKKKADLEQQSKDTKRWLQNATRLDGALGSELGRWSELVTELKSSLLWLVGNVLLSAGMISYGGAFVMSYRTVMENSWKKQCDTQGIAVDPEFSLGRVLGDDVTTRQWRILGLPEDTFSTENGLITTLAGRWPLIIDPQEQGNRWIRNLEADNQLQITTASDSNFLRILENSVRSGLPLLLENVGEQLDSSLEPILLKSIFKRGGEDVIRLGEKVLPYDSNFKLYMTTKLSNPHYLPEVCVKVTLINFGITRRGLEEQLLVDVVRHDRPDLEERKDTLITSIAADRASLGETEDRVLNMLSEATGNILDNEELIVKLEEAKVTSNVVKIRIAEAEETKKEITLAREGYRPAATRGSIIYFVITQLALIDSMYQYSLQFFTKLYTLRLAEVAMSEDLGIRLGNLMEDITASFHSAVCLGLFEKDKQAYALLLATAILQARGDLDNLEWLYFVAGGVGSVGEPDLLMPEAAWVTPFVWASLNSLEKTFPQYFSGLKKHVRKNLPLWETFVSKKGNGRVFNCLPAPWKDTLTPFQSLLLVRALDDTILLPAITEFIGIALGESFRSPPSLDLRKVLATSMCDQPLLFLCSSGADPTNALLQLSRDTECHVRTVSLGQGQGPVAVNHMEHGMRDGDWVLLQNCHLAVSFLPQLEEIVVTKLVSAAGSLHPDFRLWLTSMPTKAFPSSILQAALKMSVQPPRGIRANMLQSFASNVEQSDIDKFVGTAIDIPYRRLIYGLSIFHALALERCKFGGLGWNKPYEWMASDLKTALLMCGIYCESAAEMKTEAAAVAAVPFPALSTMVGAVTYGGRVTDAQDNPTLESILAAFITPNAMADGYEFTSGGGHVHTAPAKLATLEDFSTHVSQLPLFDDPAVFGLHANANISFQRKENRVFMETILQSQSGGTSGDSSQADDGNVTKISLRILSNLEGLEEADAGPDTFEKDDQGGVNAIGVCLKNELIRFNKLTRTIKFTLEELLKALKGLVVMSEGIENMERSMRVQQVPALWAAVAYPSLKPFDGWMQDYFSRIKSFEVWLKQAPPSSFWLSSFFFPQGFVSSVKQTFARKSLVPIDQLDLQTIVTSKTENEALQGVPPNTGVYVHGLYLNGAGFDAEKGEIRHSRPGEIYSEMPVVHLLPYDIAAEATGRLEETYTCPCYKTSLRWGTLSTTGHSTNFVMPYQLKCPPGINAQQLGVALVLQLDM